MEIFYKGNWGTVCDDDWDMNDARVVCRQLGFPDAVSAPHSARFDSGSGQIWLDDVRCSGSESSIVNCQHRGWGVENCGHSEDASVICSGKLCTKQSSRRERLGGRGAQYRNTVRKLANAETDRCNHLKPRLLDGLGCSYQFHHVRNCVIIYHFQRY